MCVLGALLLGGCHVDATATTRMRPNGTGVVEVSVALDPQAVRVAEAGGGKLESRIVTTDLVKAGWAVDPWVRSPDGSAKILARKAFARPSDVATIYAEISGAKGPFRSVRATQRDGFISNEWTFAGTLDMTAPDPGVVSDEQLAQKITGSGFDPAKVQQLLASGISSSLTIKNRAELPNAAPREWTGKVGAATAMRETASKVNPLRASIVVGGVACIVLGLVFFFAGEARSRRVRRRAARR